MSIPSPLPNAAAKRVLLRASQEAARTGCSLTAPEHLLIALLSETNLVAGRIMRELGVDTAALLATLRESTTTSSKQLPPHSDALRRVVLYAEKEAQHLRHRQIDSLHLLLGLFYDEGSSAAQLLQHAKLSLYDMRTYVMGKPAQFTAPVRVPLYALVRPSPIFLGLLASTAGSGVWLCFSPPELLVQPLTVLFVLCGWVVSVCIHEFCHAAAAYLGGDDTVVHSGYLTLNPLKYTHPLLSIMLPLLFILLGGFGLPGGAVYINTRALRTRWWNSLVSASGPLGTLLCLLLVAWPFFFDWVNWVSQANLYFWPALALLAFLQVTALVFNLLPIPSLDGFGILAPWLPLDVRFNAFRFGQVLLVLMLVILWQDTALSAAFWSNMYGFAGLAQILLDLVDYGWTQLYEGVRG